MNRKSCRILSQMQGDGIVRMGDDAMGGPAVSPLDRWSKLACRRAGQSLEGHSSCLVGSEVCSVI